MKNVLQVTTTKKGCVFCTLLRIEMHVILCDTLFVLNSNETTETVQSPKARKISFSFPVDPIPTTSKHDSEGQIAGIDPSLMAKELTCISEEGLIDMDFQVII